MTKKLYVCVIALCFQLALTQNNKDACNPLGFQCSKNSDCCNALNCNSFSKKCEMTRSKRFLDQDENGICETYGSKCTDNNNCCWPLSCNSRNQCSIDISDFLPIRKCRLEGESCGKLKECCLPYTCTNQQKFFGKPKKGKCTMPGTTTEGTVPPPNGEPPSEEDPIPGGDPPPSLFDSVLFE